MHHCLGNRTLEQTNKALTPAMQGVLNEVIRWEDIPEWLEPFTLELLRYSIELLHSKPYIYGQGSDSVRRVDWASAGLYDDFRLTWLWPAYKLDPVIKKYCVTPSQVPGPLHQSWCFSYSSRYDFH